MSALLLVLACVKPAPPAAAATTVDPLATPSTAAAMSRAWQAPARPDLPPNVIVVVIDDMGVDKQAAYGTHPAPSPTPNLDALAARSLVFEHAWVMPGCTPTRAAALTGRMAARTGAGVPEPMPPPGWELPLAEVTIPEMLRSAPDTWSTAAIGKWHLADFPSASGIEHPVRQGFGSWAGTLGNPVSDAPGVPEPVPGKKGYYHHAYVGFDGALGWSDEYATTETTNDALEVMSGLQPPFFAWIGYNAVHTPLEPPPLSLYDGPAGAAERDPVRYDAVAGALDAELGRLLAGIPADVLARSVLVVFGDNGTPAHAIRPPAVPAHGKMTLYEGGVRVPLYVSGPGVTVGRTARLTHIVDLLPTVAAIAGVDVTALRNDDGRPVALDGTSWLPAHGDPAAPGPDMVYTEILGPNGPPPWRRHRRAARDASFKLVSDGVEERLFDVRDGSDDGQDLLAAGELAPDAAAALEKLRAEIGRHVVPYGFEDTPPPLALPVPDSMDDDTDTGWQEDPPPDPGP